MDKKETLDTLTEFTHDVLLPAMDERFVGEKEFSDFQDETRTNFDHILKKIRYDS